MPPKPPLVYLLPHRPTTLVEEETFARLYRSRELLANRFDLPLRLADAAGEACLSPFHYHRMFVRAFGETPHQFLTKRRIDRAKQLLARDECPVTEVCLAVGYESLGTFSTRFRSVVGKTPTEFRQTLRRVFPAPYVAPHRFIPSCYLLAFGARPF